MKGIKKIVFFALLIVAVIAFSGTMALAADSTTGTDDSKIISAIDKTNQYVDKAIDKAISDADKGNKTTDQITDKLIEKTDKKVDQLLDTASKDNITVGQEYIPVTINDQTVLIDPCYAY